MRLLSLRPERSASANSATSAFFCWRVVFYLKRLFCQRGAYRPDLAPHCVFAVQVCPSGDACISCRPGAYMDQQIKLRHGNKFRGRNVMVASLSKLFCPAITVLLGNIPFGPQTGYSMHQERSCHVCRSCSDLGPIARPRWFRCVCIPIQLGRTQQHGSSGEMRNLPLP